MPWDLHIVKLVPYQGSLAPDNTSQFTDKESTACNSKITATSFLLTPPEKFNGQVSEGSRVR